ncbi:MAG: DUF4325 domain-containing protein [Candidatus Harrisonbacteria bacterium]|nr:DUF4325 domain-containing protein [Candidatus Harrisonbacteria bacterium]
MKIQLSKFGMILTSRQLGKEAYAALQPSFRAMDSHKSLEIDFSGVASFSPAWGDEFLTPLFKKFGERIILKNTENSSVQATLEILKEIKAI